MRGNRFLVHGHKKDLHYMTCLFHIFKNVVKKMFSVSHFTSHFFAKTFTSIVFEDMYFSTQFSVL